MAPPRPPWRVDIRRTASRAHRNDPTTLVARMRVMRAASIASTRICALEHAGVVHQRGHRPQLAVTRGEEVHDVGFDGDVRLERHGAAACGGDVGDDGIGGVAAVAVVDGDRVAARRRQAGNRGADAATAAGDEEDAIGVAGGHRGSLAHRPRRRRLAPIRG